MTDRDHFAASALTGLLSNVQRYQNEPLTRQAFEIADFMLRERCRSGGDCLGQDNAPNHDAAPAARAESDEDRTDKAATSHRRDGTGDTPKPINACVSDRSQPINGPDPDSRVWETPVHTPAPHATPGEGSVPRDGTEPVAWGVAGHKGLLYATAISRMDAVDMQSEHECDTEVVPLYRHPPVTEHARSGASHD